MNKHNLKVGQTLYIEPARSYASDKSELLELNIESIGRVWAKLKHLYYRVNLETLALDTGDPKSRRHYGTVWLSKEQRLEQLTLNADWRTFCQRIQELDRNRPAHITSELIQEVRAKLGI